MGGYFPQRHFVYFPQRHKVFLSVLCVFVEFFIQNLYPVFSVGIFCYLVCTLSVEINK